MRLFDARTGSTDAAVGIAVFGALTLVTLSGSSVASAGTNVHGFQAQVGALKVQVYSQMCDNGGQNLHTRLAVRNTGSTAKSVMVHDPLGPSVYDPPGPIPAGKGMLVHLTMTRDAPEHTLTVSGDGETVTMTVPDSPCNSTTTTSTTKKPPTSTTKPTTSTSKPVTSSTINTVPVGPGGGPGDPGDPGGGVIVGAGVVGVGASVGNNGAVKAASTGTLPFTGSDIRGFAVLGNLLVLIGFALLFISHRSPKATAFFKRLRPTANS